MTEVLLSMWVGLLVNLITYLSWKLNISKTYVSVWLCVFVWVLLYCLQIWTNNHAYTWEQILGFASGAYAMSQMVYNIAVKLWIIKKEEAVKSKK